VEVSALKQPSLPGLRGALPLPLLRLQADDRLIALTRRGNQAAFEALVARYQARLQAFCRHLLGSREDAEDVLQEVFAAAFNAILADERPINARPWLYRIARNRCLNHLRRNTAIGVDSMDIHFADAGQTTGEKVAKREEFRLLLADIGRLPETQRTALLLREMEALSYQQIAEVMDTTVPSVKSLLVRARVTLAEVAESRRLTCDEVRLELGAIAEGLTQETSPIRRHLKECERCRGFRGQLRETNRALAAVLPVAPLLLFKHLALKKLLLAKLGTSAGAGGAGVSTATAGGASTAGAAGALTAGGGGAGLVTAGAGALATKAAAGLAAAAIVTAGAVEARHVDHPRVHRQTHPAPLVVAPPAQDAPRVLSQAQQLATGGTPALDKHHSAKAKKAKPVVALTTPPAAALPVATKPLPDAHTPIDKPTTQQVSSTTVLPPQPQQTSASQPQQGTSPSGSSTSGSSTSGSSTTAPPAGATGPTGPSSASSGAVPSAVSTAGSGSTQPAGSSSQPSGSTSSASSEPPLAGTTPSKP
jgi:RNA polymerase sigma factor (sigma-70 family)